MAEPNWEIKAGFPPRVFFGNLAFSHKGKPGSAVEQSEPFSFLFGRKQMDLIMGRGSTLGEVYINAD